MDESLSRFGFRFKKGICTRAWELRVEERSRGWTRLMMVLGLNGPVLDYDASVEKAVSKKNDCVVAGDF